MQKLFLSSFIGDEIQVTGFVPMNTDDLNFLITRIIIPTKGMKLEDVN